MTAPARPGVSSPARALRRGLWASAAGRLVAPAIAMRFTDPVDRTAADSAVVLLFGSLTAHTLLVRRIASARRRIAIGMLLCAGAGMLWVDGAVDMVGDEDHPATLAFAASAARLIATAAGAGLRAPCG